SPALAGESAVVLVDQVGVVGRDLLAPAFAEGALLAGGEGAEAAAARGDEAPRAARAGAEDRHRIDRGIGPALALRAGLLPAALLARGHLLGHLLGLLDRLGEPEDRLVLGLLGRVSPRGPLLEPLMRLAHEAARLADSA